MEKLDFAQFRPMIDRFVADAGWFCPEFVLILVILLLLLVDLLLPRNKSVNLVMLAFMGVLLTFAAVIWDMLRLAGPVNNLAGSPYQFPYLFQGMIKVDPFGYFFKILICIGAAGSILMTFKDRRFQNYRMGEYYALLLSATLGMFLMVSATNMLMLFLAIEMTSIPSYLLVGFHRDDPRSSEASLKYIMYGAVSTGMMLFGLSLLYGFTGSLQLEDFSLNGFMLVKISDPSQTIGSLAGLIFFLIFAGIAYKISTVPMHFWTPDVYEGAPTPITAFLAITSKAAGFAMLLRIMDAIQLTGLHQYTLGKGSTNLLTHATLPGVSGYVMALALISALTMTIGNFMALHQTNIKRLLAYSSIAHAGYILMGVCVLNDRGQSATLFYLVAYLLMNLGAFYITMMVSNSTGGESLSHFVGLGKSNPFYAACMTVMLFSLVGIPPTMGFSGKFQLFAAALTAEGLSLWWLVLVAGLNTAVSLYYYAKIVKAMYLEDTQEHPGLRTSTLSCFLVFILTFTVLLFGVCFNWIIEAALHAKL